MRIRRKLLPVAVGIAALAEATSAKAASPAADFASSGTAIISVDLMPIVSYTSTSESTAGGGKTTNSATSIALVTSNAGNAASAISFRQLPRLAFDYVVGPGITVGGSAWVFANLNVSQSTTPPGGGSSTSSDQPKATYWGVAPRVGYVAPIGNILALWPRVGIEYGDIEISATTSTIQVVGNPVTIMTGGSSVNQLALDVDALFVVTPIEHLGLTIGPTVAIPLTGKVSSSTTTNAGTSASTSNDISMWYVALTLGVLGYF
jgi:hypothetical protein